ncbi:3-isopropylmalate dehydratase, small subunit [Methanococcus vannielii SB]|uniref:Methanogen homoaconitase small subunit n=1 Tax=Methanococcus vannielii (strain ATCC 35089 / DSM 1224 / JCM 13029 / OCM 148 / SB) TaxID=406327 RepID=A6URZ3_METVS|nr:homoaconitase small subunit [Methanococcus vannielii]ABR55265.1 3-isopropylmalate dehydratase, small subunit [Methanococcus vannielii SB]
MKLKGKAHVFSDDVDTDAIIPGAYLRTTDVYELASHCMAGIDENFPKKVNLGDFIVAGENFGCGSSREQAPISIKYLGISAIIAESFARIFYRNSINLGVIPIECKNISKHVKTGDLIELDLENKKIILKDIVLECTVPTGKAKEIIDLGGLINYAKAQMG